MRTYNSLTRSPCAAAAAAAAAATCRNSAAAAQFGGAVPFVSVAGDVVPAIVAVICWLGGEAVAVGALAGILIMVFDATVDATVGGAAAAAVTVAVSALLGSQ